MYSSSNGNTGWTQLVKLLPSDGTTLDWFGYSISMYGNVLAVGSFFATTPDGVNSGRHVYMSPPPLIIMLIIFTVYVIFIITLILGAVYVFYGDSIAAWSEVSKLVASDGAAYDYFGNSISVYDHVVAIGAFRSNVNNISSAGAFCVCVFSHIFACSL